MNHGAGVIIVNKDGTVLMQHRENKPGIFYPDYWGYPAGSVEQGEDYKAAAIRELVEETGYLPSVVYPLTDEIYVRSDGQQVNRHIYWTFYDDKQSIQCNEGLEMKFVHPNDFAGKKFLPGQEKLFKLALQKAKSVNYAIT